VKVTDEMKQRALREFVHASPPNTSSIGVETAIEAALEGFELVPFELTGAERDAYAGYMPEHERVDVLRHALDRAQRTLVPKQAEQPSSEISAELWAAVRAYRASEFSSGARLDKAVEAFASAAQLDALLPHERCTCEVIGNLQMSTGCALHGEGEERSVDELDAVEADPDAPKDIAALPDYWDERRKRQGKPDLSRCAAELRVALASSAVVVPLSEEEARIVHESGDWIGRSTQLAAILRKRFPRPTPKPLHRIAFEASLASKHAADSEEYWQDITAAVVAAGKAATP
jgi:hypothetical protein